MNEKLGLYEEIAANRAKYAWKSYIPPHDRLPAPEPEPAPEPRPKKRLGLGPRSTAIGRAKQVIAAFAKAFEVDINAVQSNRRSRKIARPRQAAMYFLHVEMEMTTTPAGKMLGRDHTTVLHAKAVVAELLNGRDYASEDFAARYHRAVRALRALWAAP